MTHTEILHTDILSLNRYSIATSQKNEMEEKKTREMGWGANETELPEEGKIKINKIQQGNRPLTGQYNLKRALREP
jgi:hypothetical protein